MNKKKNITYLISGFIGVMLSVFGINMFNTYILIYCSTQNSDFKNINI